ncbi:MAG: PAS domain S-box protein [Candidatus Cloacimonetes bacterium]|nr:PAS domain S-box protein [Candidatus Cloacimonadota bacterium]
MKKEKIRVLYIDDNPMDRALVRDSLEKEHGGFILIEASTENEFEKLLNSGSYDVILTDFNILGFDGLQVINIIQEKFPEIPVIVVTGTGNEQIAVKMMKKGVSDYIIKSSEQIIRLPRTINNILEIKQIRMQKKETDKLLKESEEKYRSIFESTGTATMIVNADTTIEMANSEVLNVTGYDRDELKGRKWTDFVEKESLSKMQKYHKLRREDHSKAPKKYVVKLINKAGQTRFAILDIGMISGTSQSVVSILDITERIEAEQKLKVSAKHWNSTFNAINDIIAVISKEHEILEINQTGCNALQKKREEIIGKKCYELVHNTTIPLAECPCSYSLETGKTEVSEYEENGQHYLLTAWPIFDDNGKVYAFSHSVKNITKSKESSRKLMASEKKYRTLVENMNEGIIVADVKENITYTNAAVCKILGYSDEELLKMNIADIVTSGDFEKVLTQTVQRKKGISSKYELQILRKDKTLCNILLTSSPLFDNDENYQGSFGILRDVTKERQADKKTQKNKEDAIRQRDAIVRISLDKVISFGSESAAFEKLVTEAAKTLKVGRVSLWLFTKNKSVLKCSAIFDRKDSNNKSGIVLKSSDYSEYFKAIQNNAVVDVYEARTDPRTREFTKGYLIPLEIQSMLDVGIKNEGELVGLVCFEHRSDKRKWSLSEVSFANTVAAIAAQILTNTKRKESEKIQETIFKISNVINRTDKLPVIYSQIRDTLDAVIDTTSFYIAIYDELKDVFTLNYHNDKEIVRQIFPAGKSLTGYVIHTGKPYFGSAEQIEQLAEKGVIDGTKAGARAKQWIGVPLKDKKKTFGVIAVQSFDNPDLYEEKDMQILSFIANEISQAIKHKQAIKQIEQDLDEKQLLLKELYHRTRNNMQLIASLLKMQTQKHKDESVKSIFQEVNNRIKAMALVHSKLYHAKDLSRIDLKGLILDLVKSLSASFKITKEALSISYDMDSVELQIDSAIPLSIVLNELISNIFHHAFEGNKNNEMKISLHKDKNDNILIQLYDNGKGLSDGLILEEVETMGLHTAYSLVTSQLKGNIDFANKEGLTWNISFKDNLYKKRV